MLKYEQDVTARVSGVLQPMLGVQVTVTASNGLLATLYADDESTVLANPLTTDANGYFGFKAANGEYTLTFAGAQIETSTRKIKLYDADDDPPLTLAQAAGVTGAERIGGQWFGEVVATLAQLGTDAGASLIGFKPHGDSKPPVSISDQLCGRDVPDPEPRGYWSEVGSGVNIHRMRDRVFVGAGAKSSGRKVQAASETWLTDTMGAYWFERGAQVLSLSTYGQFGGVFAARTADQDLHDYGTAAIGVVGLANNDRTNGDGIAWGGYFEANRQASVPVGEGTTYGIEVALKNNAGDVVNNPYNVFPGGATIGHWLAGGGDPSYNGAGANPVTAAIVIGKNGQTWNKGIVFDAVGLTGSDGVNGTAVAISMAKGHVIEWQLAGGLQGASVHSEVTSNAQRTGLRFNNDQVWVTSAGSLIGTIEKGTGTASYLRMISAGAGSPAQLKATSTDANSDLLLSPQGTGAVRFGFFTASADAAVNGYIGIKDAAGTFRKLATIA